MGFKRREEDEAARGAPARGDGEARHHRCRCRSDCAVDHLVRALRLPESHAASFALIAYASAYLKAHFPAAFYTALLNNQPMGFYHPATLVKDAQRRGVRFAPIDVQVSGLGLHGHADGAIRSGAPLCHGIA
jgi:hypothetical protein